MPSPPASSKGESDIENTAELPSPQPAANPGSGDRRSSATDTWIAPPLAGARSAEAPATPGPADARHGDSAVQTLTGRLRETQQRLAQDRARTAGAMDDLREERERVLGLIESLQSAESRRGILEELVGDLQREGEERERELARVARALVGRDARTRELEAELAQSASRIARLEQQASSLADRKSVV